MDVGRPQPLAKGDRMDELTCRVDSMGDVITVRPSGTLDLANAAQLCAVLNRALAEAPTAIIVDLTDLAVRDDAALTLFPVVAKQAAAEPTTTLMLCGPRDAVAEAIAALGLGR